MPRRSAVGLVLSFASACGAPAGPAPGDGGDGAPDAGAPAFEWPTDEPAASTLSFHGRCSGERCVDGPAFGRWHVGHVSCTVQDGKLRLRTGEIAGGAASFTFSFVPAPDGRTTLVPADTTLDWTLPDRGTAFFFMSEPEPPEAPSYGASSGSVALERCGEEVAGKFRIVDACEYHTCFMGPEPWLVQIDGAFRCIPSSPVACTP